MGTKKQKMNLCLCGRKFHPWLGSDWVCNAALLQLKKILISVIIKQSHHYLLPVYWQRGAFWQRLPIAVPSFPEESQHIFALFVPSFLPIARSSPSILSPQITEVSRGGAGGGDREDEEEAAGEAQAARDAGRLIEKWEGDDGRPYISRQTT